MSDEDVDLGAVTYLPNKTGTRIGELITQKYNFHHKRKHLACRFDDGEIWLCGGPKKQ